MQRGSRGLPYQLDNCRDVRNELSEAECPFFRQTSINEISQHTTMDKNCHNNFYHDWNNETIGSLLYVKRSVRALIRLGWDTRKTSTSTAFLCQSTPSHSTPSIHRRHHSICNIVSHGVSTRIFVRTKSVERTLFPSRLVPTRSKSLRQR